MKTISLISLILISCNGVQKPEKTKSITEIDSLLAIEKAKYRPPAEIFKDTIGVAAGPVKIISAKLVKDEYSNKRDIEITCKNVSNKNIEGVLFHWMTKGVWETEDVGRYASLRTSELLKIGRTQTYSWNINSNNKQVYLCWPHEVVFSDGTRWKLDNK